MTTTGPVVDAPVLPDPSPPGVEHPLALRLAAVGVLVLWVGLVAATVVGGERSGTWQELRSDLLAGSVTEVSVSDGLGAGSRGYSVVEVTWRDGPLRRSAEVLQVSGPGAAARAVDSTEVSTVVRQPVPELVRGLDPGVRVTSAELSGGLELMGWRAPERLGGPFLLAWVATGVLVALVPRPRVATPAAWLWLVFGTAPVGSVAFLLLSGVLRRHAPAPGAGVDRRLTGGWALLLAVVGGSVLRG